MPVKKRILIVANELSPYLELTDFSKILNQIAVKSFEKGYEVRVIMPRFGVINERRHRLHEVVRLSGINIGVDKEDYPLLIKVASLPNARLQVYFMDNEDFFRRKLVFKNEDEKFFEDNVERMLFFTKSTLEIVKKFGWPPDVIHCHGWMTSMLPAFLKTSHQKEPVFEHSKVVFTAQNSQFDGVVGERFSEILENSTMLDEDARKLYNTGDFDSLLVGASTFSDTVICGDNVEEGHFSKNFTSAINEKFVPFNLDWEYDVESIMNVYETLMEEVAQ